MGSDLKNDLFQAVDLNEETFGSEFTKLIEKHGFKEETLTLDQLRIVLADEIQDLFLEIKKSS
jgi:hypothetical protein